MRNPTIIFDEIYFKCQMCAECCKHWKGLIYLSIFELNNIAKKLNITLEEMLKSFVHLEESSYNIENQDVDLTYIAINEEKNMCIFLEKNTNKCLINDVKPFMCKIYPFWSILMEDEKEFKEYSKKCKGLNAKDGIRYTSDQIQKMIQNEDEYLENLNRIAIIMNSIDEDEILESIIEDQDIDLEIDEEALSILKNNLIIEKIRILINQNS